MLLSTLHAKLLIFAILLAALGASMAVAQNATRVPIAEPRTAASGIQTSPTQQEETGMPAGAENNPTPRRQSGIPSGDTSPMPQRASTVAPAPAKLVIG